MFTGQKSHYIYKQLKSRKPLHKNPQCTDVKIVAKNSRSNLLTTVINNIKKKHNPKSNTLI